MISLKLAYRNLIGAGLRTWLNVIVLSFAYVVIIWHKGFLQGWDEQARKDTIEWEIGGGQYWQQDYDPFDPLSLEDGHAVIPSAAVDKIEQDFLTPILALPAAMYPQGRIQSVVLKGIDPQQSIIAIPSSALTAQTAEIPAVIGSRMARNNKLAVNDILTIRWRDANGTFDARDVQIVAIFRCNVATVDMGQIWLPLEQLRQMAQMPQQASILVADKAYQPVHAYPGWALKDQKTLLQPIQDIINMKSIGGLVIFFVLLLLAMLAIFDTQVLSIFRRRREIGTLMALGMERVTVIGLFTFEGALHGILALIAGAVYGIPLMKWTLAKGIPLPGVSQSMGISLPETLYPSYGAWLVAGTTLLVFVSVTVVSFLPASKIATMKPTEALRGKRS